LGWGNAKGRSPVAWELRPHDRSRCAEHGGGARPTGGSHGLTTDTPAQRFKGTMRWPRWKWSEKSAAFAGSIKAGVLRGSGPLP
jgi:hypothetical protein